MADGPGAEVGWRLELLRPSTLLHRTLLTCGVLGTQALLGNFSQGSKAQTYSQTWQGERKQMFEWLVPPSLQAWSEVGGYYSVLGLTRCFTILKRSK